MLRRAGVFVDRPPPTFTGTGVFVDRSELKDSNGRSSVTENGRSGHRGRPDTSTTGHQAGCFR
jgi:hypothetical protein